MKKPYRGVYLPHMKVYDFDQITEDKYYHKDLGLVDSSDIDFTKKSLVEIFG